MPFIVHSFPSLFVKTNIHFDTRICFSFRPFIYFSFSIWLSMSIFVFPWFFCPKGVVDDFFKAIGNQIKFSYLPLIALRLLRFFWNADIYSCVIADLCNSSEDEDELFSCEDICGSLKLVDFPQLNFCLILFGNNFMSLGLSDILFLITWSRC